MMGGSKSSTQKLQIPTSALRDLRRLFGGQQLQTFLENNLNLAQHLINDKKAINKLLKWFNETFRGKYNTKINQQAFSKQVLQLNAENPRNAAKLQKIHGFIRLLHELFPPRPSIDIATYGETDYPRIKKHHGSNTVVPNETSFSVKFNDDHTITIRLKRNELDPGSKENKFIHSPKVYMLTFTPKQGQTLESGVVGGLSKYDVAQLLENTENIKEIYKAVERYFKTFLNNQRNKNFLNAKFHPKPSVPASGKPDPTAASGKPEPPAASGKPKPPPTSPPPTSTLMSV